MIIYHMDKNLIPHYSLSFTNGILHCLGEFRTTIIDNHYVCEMNHNSEWKFFIFTFISQGEIRNYEEICFHKTEKEAIDRLVAMLIKIQQGIFHSIRPISLKRDLYGGGNEVLNYPEDYVYDD